MRTYVKQCCYYSWLLRLLNNINACIYLNDQVSWQSEGTCREFSGND